ncbi:carbamoyl-phosphate synthase large subunit [Oscillospiraceae bacterium MB08-C2-2]|nr:carbamoyl-phosphate synthase large subunit [Oscillospiraceae bacterium MB08-C2-2]
MPKREGIHKILIIGSGPIIIGQACEFDYSGTQACKALKKLGYEIVLVNSNPATIMTDPETADITYIEPLNVERVTEIIAKERPDAVLPNLGGQSGLNLCSALAKAGSLEKYGVKVIGVDLDAIERGEDRIAFKEQMDILHIEMARSEPAYSVKEALECAVHLGYPVVIRPAYTMGGAGGGLVYNEDELKTVVSRGISASMVGQVLVEESVLGWEELEVEVVRDSKDQMITVCFIENIDPMGVHTGDSFCSAPMLTISQELQNRLQEYAYRIVRSIGVIGGTNVQFAHDPVTDRVVVIEINPRTSRSSALASKATGFPIALISSMLAAGLTLDEIPYWKGGTLADYKPSGDYIVVKFARWAFEKFKNSVDHLGTQMRAVGEVMSIGKTYKEALQKAIRSLEIGRFGLGFAKNFNALPLEKLMEMLEIPTSERQFVLYEALRKGATVESLVNLTHIKAYFIEQMKELVETEKKILSHTLDTLPGELLVQAKQEGFADRYLALLLRCTESQIAKARIKLGAVEGWEAVPVSGVEDAAYYYSTYNAPDSSPEPSERPKVMILGGGPNRIGQGIEFDYCCVHAAFTLRKLGYETIIVNCNPETVSTDYDTSDKLYFEPLTVEDVLSIYQKEKPVGVIAQFGGQTPLNLAAQLEKLGVTILGTLPSTIAMAEDRDLFRAMMKKLGIPMPQSDMAANTAQAVKAAKEIGYPVMVRPSYVLGGAGMRVIQDEASLVAYMENAVGVNADNPILVDKFLQNAKEVEADAISDGTSAFVPAIMEHIELAGIHSGDSACVIPSITLSKQICDTITEYTRRIAVEMGVRGLLNIQYAIADGVVYILEANPRASRTVPLVSKVCNIRMVPIATQIIMSAQSGKTFDMQSLKHANIPHFGVKEAVFPFNMFSEVDPVLGPEMLSTGEVLGISSDFGFAFFKAQEAASDKLPLEGTVFISVTDSDKQEAVQVAKGFVDCGFDVIATQGTAQALEEAGISCRSVDKLHEGSNEILDMMDSKKINIVINTPVGGKSAADDSYIRKSAVKNKTAYVTTMAAAQATVVGIKAEKSGSHPPVKSLQQFHSEIH